MIFHLPKERLLLSNKFSTRLFVLHLCINKSKYPGPLEIPANPYPKEVHQIH